MELMDVYGMALWSGLALGLLMLLQVVVADFAGILAGHKPGMPVAADTASFHFRAARTVANSNESVAIFVLFLLLGVLLSADPQWLNYATAAFFICRAVYALFYYTGFAIGRSVVFGVSLLALAAMLAASFLA